MQAGELDMVVRGGQISRHEAPVPSQMHARHRPLRTMGMVHMRQQLGSNTNINEHQTKHAAIDRACS